MPRIFNDDGRSDLPGSARFVCLRFLVQGVVGRLGSGAAELPKATSRS